MLTVIKKDGTRESFDIKKIFTAIEKSAERICSTLTKKDRENFEDAIYSYLSDSPIWKEYIETTDIHSAVIFCLRKINRDDIADSYQEYRDYKTSYAKAFNELKEYADEVLYRGDRENANYDSALISTKGSLLRGHLAKNLYTQFYLSKEEKQYIKRGDIYIHDLRDMLFNSFNCCLADFATVMKGGFEAANIKYTEPTSAYVAINLIGDLVLMTAPNQFGGMTVPEIDKTLLPYCYKTLEKGKKELADFFNIQGSFESAYVWHKLERELEQGFQALELKLNSIASARGDYPFSTITFGGWNAIENRTELDNKILALIDKAILKQRIKGHGGLPVVFPKLVYLWDEDLIKENKYAKEVFKECVKCCAKRQYPDMLSLTGSPETNAVAQQYLESNRKVIVSPMGCRAFLSPYKDDKIGLVAVGRCNIGR